MTGCKKFCFSERNRDWALTHSKGILLRHAHKHTRLPKHILDIDDSASILEKDCYQSRSYRQSDAHLHYLVHAAGRTWPHAMPDNQSAPHQYLMIDTARSRPQNTNTSKQTKHSKTCAYRSTRGLRTQNKLKQPMPFTHKKSRELRKALLSQDSNPQS